jgi:hypothetical protein
LLICCLLAIQPGFAGAAQQAPMKLNIVIVEGEGAINNIRQRTAREPIVQVEDENHMPVAGATVYFLLPESGPGGSFAEGARSLNVVTDSNGRAVAKGFQPNAEAGKYQIQVEASYQNVVTNTVINQSNAVLTAAAAGGISGKLIAILAIAGGAIAGGVYAATKSSNGSPAPAPTPTVITPGTPSVGGP